MNIHKNQKGFTFIEVLVFTAIISFLFISMTSTVITSLQRMSITEHRMYANRHAEELMEWLRSEKESDWDVFRQRDQGNGPGTFYCFNNQLDFASNSDLQWNNALVGLDACQFNGIVNETPRIFRRYVLLSAIPPDFNQVNVQIIIEWQEGLKFYTVPLNTVFTNIDENIPTPTP